MVKLNKIFEIDKIVDGKRYIKADLIADSSLEVEDLGTDCTNIVGLDKTSVLSFGSTCFTASLEFGILNSDGIWRFE